MIPFIYLTEIWLHASIKETSPFLFSSSSQTEQNWGIGFSLAESPTLCTSWSLVEQIANCKVLNQTLQIVQPKAAPSLKGFETSCTTEPHSAGTRVVHLISQHGICSVNMGGEVSNLCCVSRPCYLPNLSQATKPWWPGTQQWRRDTLFFWFGLWILLPGLSHSGGQTRASLLILAKVISAGEAQSTIKLI